MSDHLLGCITVKYQNIERQIRYDNPIKEVIYLCRSQQIKNQLKHSEVHLISNNRMKVQELEVKNLRKTHPIKRNQMECLFFGISNVNTHISIQKPVLSNDKFLEQAHNRKGIFTQIKNIGLNVQIDKEIKAKIHFFQIQKQNLSSLSSFLRNFKEKNHIKIQNRFINIQIPQNDIAQYEY
ncbi:hypothetical protein ABPG72_020275 [Tetrahymena utriculariae]